MTFEQGLRMAVLGIWDRNIGNYAGPCNQNFVGDYWGPEGPVGGSSRRSTWKLGKAW